MSGTTARSGIPRSSERGSGQARTRGTRPWRRRGTCQRRTAAAAGGAAAGQAGETARDLPTVVMSIMVREDGEAGAGEADGDALLRQMMMAAGEGV